MGAHNSRQLQVASQSSSGQGKKALSRRASTGALLTRQERLEHTRSTGGPHTAQAIRSVHQSKSISSASSLGCLLTTSAGGSQDRIISMKTDGEDSSSQNAESTNKINLVLSRAESAEADDSSGKAPPKAILSKRNSRSLSSRIAPTLKKLAKRSSKTLGASSSSSSRQVSTSGHNELQETASSEHLSIQCQSRAAGKSDGDVATSAVEDGDLGSRLVDWNGTVLRKSWFNDSLGDDHKASCASLGDPVKAKVVEPPRVDSAADIRNHTGPVTARQCRRTASVGSLLGSTNCQSQPAVHDPIDELISTTTTAVSSLSLVSNGAGVNVRQRCSSQASQAFSTNTTGSRRSSSSSLALHGSSTSTFSSAAFNGYQRQSSLPSSSITPLSQLSSHNGRSSSRSQSRTSTGRFSSSPSCSPPLTRAPTKLELLLGFSRCAVSRCPGIGARYEDVELWVRGTDRALIKSGWQEQPFLCTGNMVLVYGIFLVALQTETVRTMSDLRGVVLTCLYIAFTYGGHEISYPLKPFLYTTDRALFWDRCMRIALSSSSLMLQINKKEQFYHDLLISLHEELYTS